MREKTLKFSPGLPEMILDGRKTTTFRVGDEKGIAEGDLLVFLARPALMEFARARVISAAEKPFDSLTDEDWEGHGNNHSRDEEPRTLSGFHRVPVTGKTPIKVIKFRLLSVVIARGAEAVLSREGNLLEKTRVKKGYRAAELDSRLRLARTRLEAKILKKAAEAGANVPKVISIDELGSRIKMEFIDGTVVKNGFSLDLMGGIAEQVALVHSAGIIHGDLTTSNMILKGGKIYLIDFGLAKFSVATEDRAVDIHVFAQALESTHTEKAGEAFKLFLEAYGRKFPDVINRLKAVEGRGRYREKATG